MDGAAWRFEQQLDMEAMEEEHDLRFHEEPEPECDDDPDNPIHDGWSWDDEGNAECDWCGLSLPQHDRVPEGPDYHYWGVQE